MTEATTKADDLPRRFTGRRDRGSTFIELLVAIVLLGTVGIGVTAALRVTVMGTRTERDHARALQWLQAASAVVQQMPRESCILVDPTDAAYSTGEQKVRERYQWAVQHLIDNPPGWEDYQLQVVAPVKVWDGKIFHDPAAPPPGGSDCYDALGKTMLQLVKIQVEDPSGVIIESIEVVKSE